ncbi:MAG TPA: hypothetical protein VKG26_13000 [Bacteroidia bacterium]|nr:hypothetical protein [Bacteroidia bacterium]
MLFFLVGCNNTPTKTSNEVHTQTEIKKEEQVKSFNNPALYYSTGTDFISFLAMLQVTQPDDYDTLLYYTSTISKSKYSKEVIYKWFKITNLNFNKKLKAIRKLNYSTYILNYLSSINATKTLRTFTVTIEQDKCKLLIEK